LLLEGGLDGLPGELPAGRDGGGLDAGEDLAVRGAVGGPLELSGEGEGLLDQQGLERGIGVERAADHGGSSGRYRHTNPKSGQPPQSITAPEA
jgi:hypothetical protein